MAPLKKFSIITFLTIIALSSFAFISSALPETKLESGFAVVELFTSEGCSSCPPADELIAKIQKESNNNNIYILSYHVDYWNRLGWKDQFSDAAFSKRQYKYSKWFKLSSVYTPQAVVNGKKEFVGSEEGTLRSTVKNSLVTTASSQIVLTEVKLQTGHTGLHYKIQNGLENTSLIVALVQKNAVSKVLRGENKGRLLSHVQVVRSFETIAVSGRQQGEALLLVPAGIRGDLEVIALLQRNNTGEIIGAARVATGTPNNQDVSK